jgi:hypothetical protein
VILFTIEFRDVNCPEHIPQKLDAAHFAPAVEKLEPRAVSFGLELNVRLRYGVRLKIQPEGVDRNGKSKSTKSFH